MLCTGVRPRRPAHGRNRRRLWYDAAAAGFDRCFALAHAAGLSAIGALMNNRLRDLRGQRHWSQVELAGRLGVSRQTIHAIETGKYDPSLSLAFKIARLFSRPIESIFQYSQE
jgi:putative transcriptional regulator